MSVKCLIYCTKAKPYISYDSYDNTVWETDKEHSLNGKIVASFDCEKVEEFNCCCVPYRKENNLGYELFIDNGVYKVEWKENINLRHEEKRYNNPKNYKDYGVIFERKDRYIDTMLKNDDLEKAKLSPQELLDYISLGKEGYAIHISNLQIFDKPKELSEYCVIDNTVEASSKYRKEKYGIYGNLVEKRIFKAPQNMQVAFENGILTEHPTNFSRYKYVLISIKPEWVAKILNGQKTIEVRRVVTNKLKKLIGE